MNLCLIWLKKQLMVKTFIARIGFSTNIFLLSKTTMPENNRLGVTSTRLPVDCTYGFCVIRQTYNSFRRELYGDGGSHTDLAVQI